MMLHQASCVAIEGRALLIEGAPGSGKSSLALALIDRGATLVGDDGVALVVEGGHLLASPAPAIAGLLEVRNVGLLRYPVAQRVPVALVARLDQAAERLPHGPDVVPLLGLALPLVRLWPDSPVLALRALAALARFGRD
ncbi:HPr kinase/phosphorylase [Novosphingobium bradum]|uniref:HPr kinase/phosphorylase n=1 Tax=Novosphingobium bradum TaxID=1737444 RepID=A0ABV7IRF4_9SPHN